MIRPVLEYGSALFDNCSIGDNLKLESCQHTAALICSGAMRRTETNLLMNMLGWESLGDRRKVSKMTLFFKIIHNQTVPYLQRNFTFTDPLTYNLLYIRMPQYIMPQSTPSNASWQLIKTHFFQTASKHGINYRSHQSMLLTLPHLKEKLKFYFKIKNRTEKFNPLNHLHDGFFGRILTQIRLKLSPLKSQHFQYNLIENPFCPKCGTCLETPFHFFVECSGYDLHRQVFFQNLKSLINNLTR